MKTWTVDVRRAVVQIKTIQLELPDGASELQAITAALELAHNEDFSNLEKTAEYDVLSAQKEDARYVYFDEDGKAVAHNQPNQWVSYHLKKEQEPADGEHVGPVETCRACRQLTKVMRDLLREKN